MEFVVKGRNTEVSDKFRTHVEDKLFKIEQFAPRAQRVEVELTHELNPAQADRSYRIEITLRDKGPVVRAEAAASDQYGALDLASQKLLEQLRRANERRTKHRRADKRAIRNYHEIDVEALMSLQNSTSDKPAGASDVAAVPTALGEEVESQMGDSPVMIRQKLYEAKPMNIEQAIYEMELVGHPFYIFIDEETLQPCAAYHRRGWTYGIIRLDAKIADMDAGDKASE